MIKGDYSRTMATYADNEHRLANFASEERLKAPEKVLTSSQLISLVVDVLGTEMPEICLDYLALHRKCYEMYVALERAAIASNPSMGRLGLWRLNEAREAPFVIASKSCPVRSLKTS